MRNFRLRDISSPLLPICPSLFFSFVWGKEHHRRAFFRSTCFTGVIRNSTLLFIPLQMAMAAARFFIRTASASRNPVFRLMSARTQATSAAPTPAAGSAADMVFTFASPSEVSSRQTEMFNSVFVRSGLFQSSEKCPTNRCSDNEWEYGDSR